ncbi:MAG: FliM/FliN family flagellar motor switch protein [Rhodobacteraceae bacterium]|nr:MAG: FliM/FliN family flagellar motor switch protein [Paracoccaceae bacterium]
MTSILRRKLSDGQDRAATREMTALRSLRLAIPRVGEDMMGLALGVIAARQARHAGDALADALEGEPLLVILDCAGRPAGAATLDSRLVTALIQQQTMGTVSDRAPEERVFTDTDAALCAPLTEEILRRAAEMAQQPADRDCLSGVRFGARAEGRRSLLLALRGDRYRVFRLTLDIAQGRQQGDLALILPEDDHGPGERAATDRVVTDAGQSPFLNVTAELTAVLARLRVPLNRLTGLQVGDVLPIPRERMDETGLVSVSGRVVARGRLGQMNGSRAVRLMAPQPVPLAAAPARDARFQPLAQGEMPSMPRPAVGMPGAGPLPIDLPGANAFAGEADDLEALSRMSPDEAAQEIKQLAGLEGLDGLDALDMGGMGQPLDLAALGLDPGEGGAG